ncbi:FAD-dependent oxidoreductase [Zhihengliuella salsuginis]|uniref:Oxidoreductase n=1 Tax=Zhihengliuella salsuginis TaxID=578222 RepID=A0ABQ3GC10_9MICC|nr:NAD(P)/FAD-dependent oxidoreductase [Zhihengliuella salsuginis]GHC98924.1 oxidoreductase [Zhihengliuella salsuginis]
MPDRPVPGERATTRPVLGRPLPERADVVVAGAGPVGLYAAILLAGAGLDVVVLERRPERSGHSRAIGIHPPALAALERAGVADELIAGGVRIPGGEARSRGRAVGELSFGAVPGRHPYVLALPQFQTEGILERRLADAAGAALHRGVEVRGLHQEPDRAVLVTSHGQIAARFVVAADGARSTVRAAAGIRAPVRTYPDTYAMGDFPETGADEDRAVLYLERAGIVESFPLPGGTRRWVARTRSLVERPTAGWLAATVAERTGVVLDPERNSMLSSFCVRRRIADEFVAGRVALAGDAAHEVSPIGGQGMNLGWLDAAMLAPLVAARLDGDDAGAGLAGYGTVRRRAARAAARQAHLNMMLGRPLPAPLLGLRNGAMGRAASLPRVHDAVARVFTMH